MNNNSNNKKRKIPVLQIILILVLVGLFVWLIYSIFDPNKAIQVDFSRFQQFVNDASGVDGPKFNKITIVEYKYSIYFTYGGKNYVTGSTRYLNDQVAQFLSSSSGGGLWPSIIPSNIFVNGKIAWSSQPIAEPNSFVVFLQSFGPILLLALLFFLSFKMQMKAMGGGGIFNQGKSQAQKIISNKKFADIAGNEEVKEEVSELVDYLKDPQKYSAAGARIPKGILLGGPPGTGKTLLAKATAGEANVPFFFISGSNFVEMFVGVGAKRVREMFAEARKEAPAIIFIDELDAVGRSRTSGIGSNDEREQTLNQLLVEMDGITDNSGILVMAATNRTDVLDPALLRPGRFDRIITVNLPDIKEREEILKLHAKGKRIDPSVTFRSLAKRTPGYSGAQLENVINEAALLSVREKTGIITKEQIDEAIDRVMSGPAKKSRTISKEELEMVAYHEAGHAVVGIKVPGGNKVQKITIIPRGNAGGYNLMMPEKEKYNQTKSELEAMIKSFMGGRAAEEIIYGEKNISTGASDDIQKATSIARRMVTEWGMSSLGPVQYESPDNTSVYGKDLSRSNILSDALGQEIDNEIKKIIQDAKKTAVKVIKENLELLELIKTSLLEKETIVAEEIEYIAKHMKLPPKDEEESAQKATSETNIDELLNDVENNSSTKTIPFDEE